MKCDLLVARARATTAATAILIVVATTAAAFVIATARATPSAAATIAAVASATAAPAAAMMLIKKLIDSSLTDIDNRAREKERFASERMVEVELDYIVLNTKDSSDDVPSLVIKHRYTRPKPEELLTFAPLRVDKDIPWHVDESLWETRAICLIGCEGYLEIIASGEVLYSFFESREHAACAKDEAERRGDVALLDERAVMAIGMELIGERNVGVLSNIHYVIVVNYFVCQSSLRSYIRGR